MSDSSLTAALAERGALLDGHFRLSSGRHSNRFIQKFRILEDPALVEPLAREIAGAVRDFAAIFVEKENGVPTLRRGFALGPGDRALIVEDVVTTGLSVREVIGVVRAHGAEPVAVAVIVRRQEADFGVPTFALLDLPVESYAPEDCPQCARGEALVEPGSRFIASK